LEGEGHDVEHKLRLRLLGLEHFGRANADRRLGGPELGGARDATLEVADGGEVFVELAPVGFAEGTFEAELPAGGLGGGWLSAGLSAEDKIRR